LKPVTASNVPSSHGSASMPPVRMSARGASRRANATIAGAASIPLTTAPRSSACAQKSPLPQPTSSNRVPDFTSSASAIASRAGSARPAQCSANVAASSFQIMSVETRFGARFHRTRRNLRHIHAAAFVRRA
jgi:hypothetical protein